MTREIPSRDEIGPDQRILLSLAAKLVYVDGTMTPGGLKREILKGRLKGGQFENGTWYTTLAWIEEMRAIARTDSQARIKPPAVPCVYIVGFGPYVKIGFTADHFERRLRALHGGFPEKLTTYATIPNGTRDIERGLHRRFAAYRLQYEWFRREGELAAWIDAGCPH